jgi:hypothetical protein
MTNTTDNSTCYLPAVIVQQLLAINKQAREASADHNGQYTPYLDPHRQLLTPAQVLRDYFTVKLGTGVKTGNTQVIIDLADENDWVFVTNLNIRKSLRGRFKSKVRIFTQIEAEGSFLAQLADEKKVVLRLDQQNYLKEDIELNGTPKRIFVDATSHMFKEINFTITDFYKGIARYFSEIEIILIG